MDRRLKHFFINILIAIFFLRYCFAWKFDVTYQSSMTAHAIFSIPFDDMNLPVGVMVPTTLSVREVRGLTLRLVKSDTASGSPPMRVFYRSTKLCRSGAKPRSRTPHFTHASAQYRENNKI